MISVILPTVAGREARFEQTRAAYKRTLEGVSHQIVVVRGAQGVGWAWNEGAKSVTGDILHFATDDAEPRNGWYDAAIDVLDAGYLPSPILWRADGSLESGGTLGGGMHLPTYKSWTPVRSAGIPTIPREVWQDVGSFLGQHYYCDDDWFWRATLKGHRVVTHQGYAFTHHETKDAAATRVIAAAAAHRQAFLERAATLTLDGVAACA